MIGGGASGALAAACLLRAAAAAGVPLRIALIDRYGRHGLGQAYATTNPAHLLNSPAGRMSALPGDPAHLVRWATANGLDHEGFLPRMAFGQYLTELLAEAERAAGPVATVSRITGDVVGLSYAGGQRPLRLRLTDGALEADLAVLATGNQPPALPCPPPGSPRYVADPWAPGALDGVADGSPVAILGTGLTMLDLAVALTDAHPGTVVHAVSRHALLPRRHQPGPVAAPRPAALRAGHGPVRLSTLIRQVRAAAGQDDWQAVVDGLRPQVPSLWQRLSPADQRLFLRHVARYWEVHRHRVPPATAARIDRLVATGRLVVRPGRLAGVTPVPDGLSVQIGHEQLRAGWLVNATGPAGDLTATADPLLRGLLDRGLIRPDPLRLGLEADPCGAVLDAAGRPSDTLFTLGPTRRGQLYETTAIPEIRDQAAVLAGRLVAASRARAAGSAA
jgi:uncharacterized NAD(P)/FAD-binding protein YdhS